MKLTFYNGDKERELGYFENTREAEKSIRDFLEDHNFKYYYFKISQFSTKAVYDVGSWSEFFILYYDDNHKLNTTGVWEE